MTRHRVLSPKPTLSSPFLSGITTVNKLDSGVLIRTGGLDSEAHKSGRTRNVSWPGTPTKTRRHCGCPGMMGRNPGGPESAGVMP